jgi:hypothetical protein
MNAWSKLAFQGKAYGFKDLSKKKRKKDRVHLKIKKLMRETKKGLSEGQMIQRDFEIMLSSSALSEKTKLFLKKLRGSYGQFGRFTSRQFEVYKKIWWQMKDRARESNRETTKKAILVKSYE